MHMVVLNMLNLHTKFEKSSLVRVKGMTGDPKCGNGLHEPDHAYLGGS